MPSLRSTQPATIAVLKSTINAPSTQATGRYICWVLFSVGAENLAKAACVCNQVVSKEVCSLSYPEYKDSMLPMDWVTKVLSESTSAGDSPAKKYYYGTLGDIGTQSRVIRLISSASAKKHKVAPQDCDLLIASYKYLTQAIRNRDAHTYVPKQRQENFPAVEPIFVPSFNTLVRTMKKNNHPGLSGFDV